MGLSCPTSPGTEKMSLKRSPTSCGFCISPGSDEILQKWSPTSLRWSTFHGTGQNVQNSVLNGSHMDPLFGKVEIFKKESPMCILFRTFPGTGQNCQKGAHMSPSLFICPG